MEKIKNVTIFKHPLLFRVIVGISGIIFVAILLQDAYLFFVDKSRSVLVTNVIIIILILISIYSCFDYVSTKYFIKNRVLYVQKIFRKGRSYQMADITHYEDCEGIIPNVKVYFSNRDKPLSLVIDKKSELIKMLDLLKWGREE